MKLLVDKGNVHCPLRRTDVAVERCFGCASFRSLERSGGTVRCAPHSVLDRLVDAVRPVHTR